MEGAPSDAHKISCDTCRSCSSRQTSPCDDYKKSCNCVGECL